MQESFDFAAADLARWQVLLAAGAGDLLPKRRRTPLGQMIKSLISSRTRDPVSLAAYNRLGAVFRSPAALAAADPAVVTRVIREVTYAEDKGAYLVAALRMIAAERPDFDLAFLSGPPLADALGWLERLPGVARKVSASALNTSILSRPVFIVDTHVLRILGRLGFVAQQADYRAASEAVTAAMPRWSGEDFLAFHILMKRLGQTICRWDVPDCASCPLAADCPTAKRR